MHQSLHMAPMASVTDLWNLGFKMHFCADKAATVVFGAGQSVLAPPRPERAGPSCHGPAGRLWRRGLPCGAAGIEAGGGAGSGWPRPPPALPRTSPAVVRWATVVESGEILCLGWFVSYSYYHSSSIIVIIIINNIIIIIITTSWNRLRYILIYIAILKEYLDLYIVRYKNHNTSFITQKPYNWNSNDLWNQGQFYNRKNLARPGRGGRAPPTRDKSNGGGSSSRRFKYVPTPEVS